MALNARSSVSSPSRLALVGLLFAVGCVSPPIGDLPRHAQSQVVSITDLDYMPFRAAPTNRYAVVMNGQVFTPPASGSAETSSPDGLQAADRLEDPWIAGDMEQLTRLLLNKGYDVYRLDFGEVTPAALEELLARIAQAADERTRLFVAYSGEGDDTGLRTRTLRIPTGQHIVPPDVTIRPADLFEMLAPIRGDKALLLNACEAGVFADAAPSAPEFRGVVIAACGRGFATTPHEPAGTTAIYAAFLELYGREPERELNLATVEIERAGGLWTNLAHHWNELWSPAGLPISYEPAVYVSGDFWF